MKIVDIIAVICLFTSLLAHGQSDAPQVTAEEFLGEESSALPEKKDGEEEKTRILISPDQQLRPQQSLYYRGRKSSLIEWGDVDEDRFLNFERWKVDLSVKEKQPRWRINLQERRLLEKVGYVLKCVGECRLYRGVGYARVDYLSTLREGDELQTLEDSYLWAYFLDGTLMRMSPKGSVTFKEINIGEKENFIFTRLNSGNILFLSRHQSELTPQDIRETDSLFLPLSFLDANQRDASYSLTEDDLFTYLEESVNFSKVYKRLNDLIVENSREVKPTEFFLVMPNGTVQGRNLSAEFIVLQGNKSYFKLRDSKQIGLKEEIESLPGTFYFRGFNNDETEVVSVGNWYEVDAKGRTVQNITTPKAFQVGEFVTKNIPTILVARELMFKKYSSFMHDQLSERQLAEEHGYRRWGALEKEGSDLNLRLKFLREYTRRSETTTLVVSEQFKKRLERRGETWTYSEYSQDYYRRAMGDFSNYNVGVNILSGSKDAVNSIRKPFWKKNHGIK
jgi:hypothetical protein